MIAGNTSRLCGVRRVIAVALGVSAASRRVALYLRMFEKRPRSRSAAVAVSAWTGHADCQVKRTCAVLAHSDGRWQEVTCKHKQSVAVVPPIGTDRVPCASVAGGSRIDVALTSGCRTWCTVLEYPNVNFEALTLT